MKKSGKMTSCYCMIGYPDECDEHTPDNPYSEPVEEVLAIEGEEKEKIYYDPKSTGRKRAVIVIEEAGRSITQGKPCEWRGLRHAGGGVFPIIGCGDGLARDIHHGPDKNTLNNDPANLHVICSRCHNRWHARNDPTFAEDVPGTTWLPEGEWTKHDPDTKATVTEIAENEEYYRKKKR